MKKLILFNSHLYTVKSVYRKKIRPNTKRIFLRVLETNIRFIFDITDDNKYNFLKRGAIITLHLGNGNYINIQEGNKLPEDKKIYCATIEYTDPRIKYRREIYKKH